MNLRHEFITLSFPDLSGMFAAAGNRLTKRSGVRAKIPRRTAHALESGCDGDVWRLQTKRCAPKSSPFGRNRAQVREEELVVKSREITKETKTAEELAAMILADLHQMDGCPNEGVAVTVYGIPWRAMLTFGIAAGGVKNKAELQEFFVAITERLQRLYSVS